LERVPFEPDVLDFSWHYGIVVGEVIHACHKSFRGQAGRYPLESVRKFSTCQIWALTYPASFTGLAAVASSRTQLPACRAANPPGVT